MSAEQFETQLAAFGGVITGLANCGDIEEYLFGHFQRAVLDLLSRHESLELSRVEALQLAEKNVRILLEVAARNSLALSSELRDLIAEYSSIGKSIPEPVGIPETKSLSSFDREPPVAHSVFVDESGTPAFDEATQPVLSLVGVLASDKMVPVFEEGTQELLATYGLSGGAEIHARDCIKGLGPFSVLPEASDRYHLLRDFVALGIRHAIGVHYMSMLKPMVAPEFKRRLDELRLDAYTSLVVWFNLTLQAGALDRIALRQYRYYFDRTDKYAKSIRRILRSLRRETNDRLRIRAVHGDPREVDSADHRFVQLADVIGFFLTRYRQFEVRTFRPHQNLLKYRPQISQVYEIVRPKLLNFVSNGKHVLVDWKALQEWSPASGGPG